MQAGKAVSIRFRCAYASRRSICNIKITTRDVGAVRPAIAVACWQGNSAPGKSLRNHTVLRGRQILWLVLDALKTHDEEDPLVLALRELEAIPAPKPDDVGRFLVEWLSEVGKASTRCFPTEISDATFRVILLHKLKYVRRCNPTTTPSSAQRVSLITLTLS